MGRRGQIDPEASPSVALVRDALKDRGMRQQELADRTGLSKDHVSRILLGKVAFPRGRDTLHAMAQALGLDPLQFPEYRHQLQVLPESTRRLTSHLKAHGITQHEWIRRILPQYSEGHLQLILRGGSPFPKEPRTIELFAQAAEADPFLFSEYLPLADWKDRLLAAAEIALDPTDTGVFKHLLGKIERVMAHRDAAEEDFGERLLKRFLARAFDSPYGRGPGEDGDRGPLPVDPELDDQLTYLPPIGQYQPEVRAMLRALHASGLRVAELAERAGVEADTLFAVANGQMKLKDGPLREAVFRTLGIGAADVAREG